MLIALCVPTLTSLGLHNTEVIHKCKYEVTFTALNNEFEDYKIVTITVNRPVTLKRISDFWLRANDGADLNEDGVVNFRDYVIWSQEG